MAKEKDQCAVSLALKQEKTRKTVVLHTSQDTDAGLITHYDARLQYQDGILIRLLEEGCRVVITGETLIKKFPNLFNEFSLVSLNREIRKLYQKNGETVLLIDPKVLNQYPWLQHLEQFTVECKPLPSNNYPAGYKGLRQAILDGNRIILAEGRKASGKSFSLTQLVKEGFAQVFSYTLSPQTTFNQLKKLIIQWAQSHPAGQNQFCILAFDEMNLVRPEVLMWLQAMVTTPEYMILPDGEIIRLSPEHCVVGLMNSAQQTGGRHEHAILKSISATVTFPPLSREVIRNEIIIPALKKECQISDNEVEPVADFLIEIRNQIEKLQPDVQLDPRNFLAIIARIASWDYDPREIKTTEKNPKTPEYRSALKKAILEIVSTELSSSKLITFQNWLNMLFADVDNDASPFSKNWVEAMLKEDKELWNIESSRQLMHSIADYFQMHDFYERKHQKSIPGKSALLLLGDTNTGKTFLSEYIGQKMGICFWRKLFYLDGGHAWRSYHFHRKSQA